MGGGLITESAHLPSALGCADVDVVALVDPVRPRIERLASSFAIRPKLAADVDEVLDDIDAAVIATPNHTHARIAIACLERGVSVLVEKPLASSVAEGRAILDAAARNSAIVAPAYVTRFRPNVRLLQHLLRTGYFGAVRKFVHQFGTRGGWAPLSAYNLSKATAGGGVLVVTATHFLDRMIYFWGRPDEVEYQDDSRGGPEANCIARFRYLQGAGFEGEARYSKTSAMPAGLVIETERCTVVLGDTDDAELTCRARERPEIVEVLRSADRAAADSPSTFVRQIEAFAAACRGDAAFPVPSGDALTSLELLERLYACRQPLTDDWYGAPS